MSSSQEHGPPYEPTTASVGGLPTKGVDVPICAVFMALYLGAAVGHMTFLQLNKRRGHLFVFSGAMFGFCMARVVTMIMRIVWACYPSNVRVAIAATILVNAGVIILFIVDVVWAQRILRAIHPHFGWRKSVKAAFTVVFVLIIFMFAMVITSVVQSAYTLTSEIHDIDRKLQMTGISYILFLSFLPIPLVVGSLLIPSREKTENFGSGSLRAKVIILLTGTSILMLGSSFRASTVYKNPRPRDDPAWYDAKWALYFFDFVSEIIVIYFYLIVRVDQRFFVPNGSKGPGDYLRGQSAGDGRGSADPLQESGRESVPPMQEVGRESVTPFHGRDSGDLQRQQPGHEVDRVFV